MSIIDFEKSYDREIFVNFFQHHFLPEDFNLYEEEVDLLYSPKYINQAAKLGECDSLNLKVYEISHQSPNDPRLSLTKDTFRLMKEYNDSNVLAIFKSPGSFNFRLSYVTLGIKPEDKKIKYEYSNPRRFSYFLGPDAKISTPYRFLIKKGRISDIDDLQNRFSIEVVNKEFYKEIAQLFTKLVGGKRKEGNKTKDYEPMLRLPSMTDHKKMQEFAVRMIGRIVFCWFLKKKETPGGESLIPEQILSRGSILIHKNYYHSILEKLFFQVLNTPRNKRREEFKVGFFSETPFLNGGLFEPQSEDFYELNEISGTSKYDNTLKVPDSWLDELFTLLETYNFTIDENTSMDVELSVDPEMLGRIFENLLAEINPETGETARKSTGSYYTPRPIVEYMVDESLKQYLLTKTEIENKKLQNLLSYSEDVEGLNDQDKERIIEALDSVKIIDPACGSGAFPMGILQKMVLILQKVDPDSVNWLIKQLDRIPDAYVRKAVEDQLMKEDWDYIRKLGIIQNSIYGVDIQQIAVEISKLRVFLSLIVDSKIDEDQENLGIKPLPNLEFKFVCANSLIGMPKAEETKSKGMFEAHDHIKKLKSLRDRYFSSFGDDKRGIEKQFKEIQDEMFKHSIEMSSLGEQTIALSDWGPFSSQPAPWFDPEWMFGLKGGFDIVIANPPYGADFDMIMKKYLFRNYPILKGQPESYEYFIFVSMSKLSGKFGIISFINPTNFIESKRAEGLRKFILNSGRILIISNFRFNVWDINASETLVFIFQKNTKKIKTKILHPKSIKDFILNKDYKEEYQDYWECLPSLRFLIRSRGILIKKIEKDCKKLGEICEISQGIIVYKTKKDSKRNLYISQILKERDWKKLLDGKSQLKPYYIKWGGNYLKYGKWLWCPRDKKFFEEEKIIFIRLRNKSLRRKLIGVFDEEKYYNRDNFNNIILKDKNYNLKYILALFNSQLINYWYKSFFDNVNINPTQVRLIPIKIEFLEKQQALIDIVDKIISITKSENYLQNPEKQKKVKEYEKEIDQMVYKLYDLTQEEIEVVEGGPVD